MIIEKLAEDIFQDILSQGGYVYIVGGSVRDYVLLKSIIWSINNFMIFYHTMGM